MMWPKQGSYAQALLKAFFLIPEASLGGHLKSAINGHFKTGQMRVAVTRGFYARSCILSSRFCLALFSGQDERKMRELGLLTKCDVTGFAP